ncbi:class II SORL domain-containing protein [Candidatus Aerophobetes bacterium]|nr:class II SORL domain-containing protein [Candidatus Aerophobetes bacterium]
MAEKNLFSQVNRPEDPNNMTDLEKKHLPVIDAPDRASAGEAIQVSVQVGKLLAHPNEAGHHIEFIDLYENDVYLTRVDFTGGKVNPRAIFEVMLEIGGTLRAFSSCNLHGVWGGDKPISIG